MIPARYFDGKSGKERKASLFIQGEELFVTDEESQESVRLLLDNLEVHLQDETYILSDGERELHLTKEDFEKLQFKPKVLARDKGPLLRGLFGASLILIMAYFYYRPAIAYLARLVPDSVYDSTAQQIISLYRPQHCLRPEQEEILGEVFRRLGQDVSLYKVFVVKSSMVNAFVMSGNILVIHDGLIKSVSGPDALAGVIAHEIAHIEKEHLKIALIKHHFLETIWAFAFGNSSNGLIKGITQGFFSQEEEREADYVAAQVLKEQGVSPQGMVNFFKERETKDPAYLKYLSFTHPDYPQRIKVFSEIYEFQPVLSEKSWATLKAGCL